MGLLSGVIDLQGQIKEVVDAYQSVTRPIWDSSLGAFLQIFGWRLPGFLKDYLSMGFIVATAEFFAIGRLLWAGNWRMKFWTRLWGGFRVLFIDMHGRPIVTFLFWPITIVRTFVSSLRNTSAKDHAEMMLSPLRSTNRARAFYRSMRHYGAKSFFGFVLWALIILMTSYGIKLTETAGTLA